MFFVTVKSLAWSAVFVHILANPDERQAHVMLRDARGMTRLTCCPVDGFSGRLPSASGFYAAARRSPHVRLHRRHVCVQCHTDLSPSVFHSVRARNVTPATNGHSLPHCPYDLPASSCILPCFFMFFAFAQKYILQFGLFKAQTKDVAVSFFTN